MTPRDGAPRPSVPPGSGFAFAVVLSLALYAIVGAVAYLAYRLWW